MPLRPWLGLVIVILIIILPIFAHVDDVPIELWDESRLANNAIEMYQTGEPLVVTYDHKPEMWNTKPPFLIWMQALSLTVFGLSDVAVRLPTSISAILTCLLLYWFFARKLKQPWIGVLTVTVLITSPGYVLDHGIRTADYDGTLTLFTTMYAICFFLFLEEDKRKYFWATIVFAICATLTKGIEAVVFLPALPLYAIYKKKAGTLKRTPDIYIGIFALMFFTLGYYLLREQFNPGYINAVMANEVGGRYGGVLEGHGSDSLYYHRYLLEEGFKPWYLLFILGAVGGVFSTNKALKNITIYAVMMSVFFGVVISFGGTKISWYTLPMYPLMAIPVAIFIYSVAELLYHSTFWKPYFTRKVLPYLFMFLFCMGPFYVVFSSVTDAHGDDVAANDAAMVLKKILKDGYPYKTKMNVILEEYQGGIEWYLKVFNLRHIPIERANKDSLAKEELVLTYDEHIKSFIEQTYNAEAISINGSATIYQVHGKK